jgi:radical SAM protein with 4Fe4S-binding SPASM domain
LETEKTENKRTKPFVYPYHLDIIGKTTVPTGKIDSKYIEYRRQWESNPCEKIVADFPLNLNIELSGSCNLMCKHCFRFSRKTDIGTMDFSLFKKIIDEGANHNLFAINPTWMGESFLHPEILDMLNYAKSKGIMDIIVNTNATLIDKKMSEKILDDGSIDVIVFSLDSITEENYDLVKYGSNFKLVNKNILQFIDLKEKKGLKKPKVIVQMIDQKQTHEEVMSFIHYWRTKADIVRIAIYESPDGKMEDKMRSHNAPDVLFPCPKIWQGLAIAWDGIVYPCTGDNSCRDPLGNVNEKSIKDLWHSDRLNLIREKHSKFEADDLEICTHCDLNKVPKIVNDYGKDENNEEVN